MVNDERQVAIYIDFDNVVISRASQAHASGVSSRVAIDALLDFAARYGRLTIARAYADWSVKQNADYRDQLVARAVELVQLFPASKTKNGADIRLAVDAIEDLYQHPGITHIVIAAGDSDFIPLAQRARRLGRVVLGVGVAGSVSRALASACDTYMDYDELLEQRGEAERIADAPPAAAPQKADPKAKGAATPRRRAFPLISEALSGLEAQYPDREWHPLSVIKNRVLQIEPTFREANYDAEKFSELLARYSQIEINGNQAKRR